MNGSEFLADNSSDLEQSLADLEHRRGLAELDPGLQHHLDGLLLPDLPEGCFIEQQIIFEPWVQMVFSIAYVVVASNTYNGTIFYIYIYIIFFGRITYSTIKLNM